MSNYEEYNEYDELEKVYYKRKRKQYLLYGSVLGVFLITAFLIYNSLNSNKKELKCNTIAINNSQTLNSVSDNSQKNENEKLILNPVIPKVNNIEEEKEEPIKKEIKKVKHNHNKEKKEKIVVKVSSDEYSLKDLIDNYNSFPNYETAIKIANIYFKEGKYHKSIEWAKKANNIDSKKEESWLIYAKSLVQLGNKKTAKKLLNAYLNIYGENKKIKDYLRSIK